MHLTSEAALRFHSWIEETWFPNTRMPHVDISSSPLISLIYKKKGSYLQYEKQTKSEDILKIRLVISILLEKSLYLILALIDHFRKWSFFGIDIVIWVIGLLGLFLYRLPLDKFAFLFVVITQKIIQPNNLLPGWHWKELFQCKINGFSPITKQHINSKYRQCPTNEFIFKAKLTLVQYKMGREST